MQNTLINALTVDDQPLPSNPLTENHQALAAVSAGSKTLLGAWQVERAQARENVRVAHALTAAVGRATQEVAEFEINLAKERARLGALAAHITKSAALRQGAFSAATASARSVMVDAVGHIKGIGIEETRQTKQLMEDFEAGHISEAAYLRARAFIARTAEDLTGFVDAAAGETAAMVAKALQKGFTR